MIISFFDHCMKHILYVLAKLLCWLWANSVKIDLRQGSLLTVLLIFIMVICIIWLVYKADAICYLLYCVDFLYIWSLKSDFSRYILLAGSLRLFYFALFDHWIQKEFLLARLMCLLWVFLVIDKWFKHIHCVSYFTKIHLGYFKIWPMVKSDTMC